MSKSWITPEGRYVRGYFSRIAPQNATEVPTPPNRETDIWDGTKWNPDPDVVLLEHNNRIFAELAKAEIASLRFLYENDQVRLAQHNASQATLREQIISVPQP